MTKTMDYVVKVKDAITSLNGRTIATILAVTTVLTLGACTTYKNSGRGSFEISPWERCQYDHTSNRPNQCFPNYRK